MPRTAAPVDVGDGLAAAVEAVGGSTREGQVAMAEAVAHAFTAREHLLVQAGTGTGKSLAYLVPAVVHAVEARQAVVVATATIALQRQLIERDLPLVADALEPMLQRPASYAILKGRHHYLCQHRLNEGSPSDDGDTLFEPAPATPLGLDVQRIRSWAEDTETGDRDELVPAPADRAWRSLSVNAHECLGATRCHYATTCFSEKAREAARNADVVVTNHAMLAIDAMSGIPLLPEHDVVVIDEAHELVDRATQAITDELTSAMVERAARRARKHVSEDLVDDLLTAAEFLGEALAESEPGRVEQLTGGLFDALVAVRDAGHATVTKFSGDKGSGGTAEAGGEQAARVQAKAAVEEVWEIAGRVVAAGEHDVVWTTASDRRPPALWRAPLSVAGLLRDKLFTDRTAVLTSATLTLGGSFDPVAGALGLIGDDAPEWTGLDVGSPFHYEQQGILYLAGQLPPPGRTGLSDELLFELEDLIRAAGGRTLGLFSSMKAAEQAAESMRIRLKTPILCQGDDATAELVRAFAADPEASLFGTLSLWQGVDVPGPSCSLVVIDRIPFPRPDDPLASARARAVAKAGGNGFMAVSATSAALLLAQGSGRLIRTLEDRGVVAVLDSRLATARYGSFLVRSMPPFWRTTDGAVARAALERLAAPPEGVPEK